MIKNIYIESQKSCKYLFSLRNNQLSQHKQLSNITKFEGVNYLKPCNDQHRHFGYRIGFDRHGFLSHPSGGISRNVIALGADMSSSTKIDNKKKYILILRKGPT